MVAGDFSLARTRAWLLPFVSRSTADVVVVQRFFGVLPGLGPTSRVWDAVFHFAANLGNEVFFIIFLPWLFWDWDVLVARQVIFLWCSSYYAIHFIKDSLMLPRPPAFKACIVHAPRLEAAAVAERARRGPTGQSASLQSTAAGSCSAASADIPGKEPVFQTSGSPSHASDAAAAAVRSAASSLAPCKTDYAAVLAEVDACTSCVHGAVKLEKQYEHEYGFPSSHTHNSVAMPFFVLYLTHGRYAGSVPLLAAALVAWCVSCILSRLYLGVHSVPDLIGGALHGVVMLALHVTYGAALDDWLLNTPPLIVAAVMVVIMVGATIIYPRPAKPAWVPTPGDTTLILSVTCGVSIAASFIADAHKAAAADTIHGIRSPLAFALTLPRLALGFGVLLAIRAIGKAACMFVLPRLAPVCYADADDESVMPDAPAQPAAPAAVAPAAVSATAAAAAPAAVAASAAAAAPAPLAAAAISRGAVDEIASTSASGLRRRGVNTADARPPSAFEASHIADSVSDINLDRHRSFGADSAFSDDLTECGNPDSPRPSPNNLSRSALTTSAVAALAGASAPSGPVATGAALQLVVGSGTSPIDPASVQPSPSSQASSAALNSWRAPSLAGAAHAAFAASDAAAPAVAAAPQPRGVPPGKIVVPHHRNYWVELPTKMVVYTLIGLNAVYTVPRLYQALGWKHYGL